MKAVTPDGSYKICVKLADAAGNVAYGSSPTVVRDTGVPTFTSVALANEAVDLLIDAAASGQNVVEREGLSVRALAKQYFEYGRWRREVVRRHPDTLSARYLAAPLAVSGVGVGTVMGLVGALGGPSWLALGWLAPAGYLALIVAGSAIVGRGLTLGAWVRLPAVLATMHVSWGVGFLTGARPKA